MRIIALRPEIHLVFSLWKKMLNSRYQEKNLRKRKAHPETSPRVGGRFNSVWFSDLNLAATDTFFFCIIITLPCELLASTATCANTNTQVFPTHRMQYSLLLTGLRSTPHGFASSLPFCRWRRQWAVTSHLPSPATHYFLANFTALHLLSLELKPTRTRSFIPFMRPPWELAKSYNNPKMRIKECEPLLSTRWRKGQAYCDCPILAESHIKCFINSTVQEQNLRQSTERWSDLPMWAYGNGLDPAKYWLLTDQSTRSRAWILKAILPSKQEQEPTHFAPSEWWVISNTKPISHVWTSPLSTKGAAGALLGLIRTSAFVRRVRIRLLQFLLSLLNLNTILK